MSWTIFRVNVLRAMKTGRFGADIDAFANFYASEYDKCIKRGGDMIYGVNVINGNLVGMVSVIKKALEKGQKSGGENFNLLQEIYPAAFDAYWNGAEMAPLPNPLLRPLGWASTPPAPGTILNIGPNPIIIAQSAAKQAALKAATEILVDKLKEQTANLPVLGEVNIYETIMMIREGKITDPKIKNHPALVAGRELIAKYEQIKKMKPGCGMQFKPSIKFPFPELPKRQKLIDEAKNKLVEVAIETLKSQLIPPIQDAILAPIVSSVQTAVAISESIPNPKPTPAQIKKFVKDTANGLKPEITLPGVSIPKIPTKEELQKMVEEKIPTQAELEALAFDLIKSKIPKIPNVWFIPPTPVLTPSTSIMINPFINLAKIHLMGTGGMMNVMAQYPPPAPPAPAVLQWSGYTIIG
jgi:hypothetical protein